MPAKPPAVEIEVDDKVVRVSNPDRVYFPESGATKLDLVEYYLAVGEPLLRWIRSTYLFSDVAVSAAVQNEWLRGTKVQPHKYLIATLLTTCHVLPPSPLDYPSQLLSTLVLPHIHACVAFLASSSGTAKHRDIKLSLALALKLLVLSV